MDFQSTTKKTDHKKTFSFVVKKSPFQKTATDPNLLKLNSAARIEMTSQSENKQSAPKRVRKDK
jgi:hypothetical protein